jgi:hypothetical protein
MEPFPRTKAALLARVRRGPASVEVVFTATTYRVDIPGDPDPNGGIWISLGPDGRYTVADYAAVHARVGGREIRLTQAETNEIAALVAGAMRSRARP